MGTRQPPETELARRNSLRIRAETLLRERDRQGVDPSSEELAKMLQELNTYQIELELQNDDLLATQLELTESRDRYSDLYDFAPVGYLTLSDKGIIREANLTAAKMLDVDRHDLLQKPLSRFVHPDFQDTYYMYLNKFKHDSDRTSCEIRLQPDTGDSICVEITGLPLQHPVGGETGLRLALNDITARKKIETEKNTLDEMLRHSQKLESLGVLAGGIAHDFNNLLMGVLGYAELSIDELPPDSPVLDNLRAIINSAHRAADLAKKMLSYAGKGMLVTEPFNLNLMVEETTLLLKTTLSDNISLMFNLSEVTPTVEGDVTQIRQVFMNLMLNASDSIGKDTGYITVNTGVVDLEEDLHRGGIVKEGLPKGRYSFFEVADDGCGMDKETEAKIFDPFFTTKFTGRGLGMAATVGIIRGHGGGITVQSEPGKGTSIKVLLRHSEEPLEDAEANKIPGVLAEWRSEATVLIVDDEETIRNLAVKNLQGHGLRVLVAEDGIKGLEIFRENFDSISLVLLDLTMPNMGGLEVLMKMQKIRPDVRVVLSSGYSEDETNVQFKGRGLAGFLQKPYERNALIETVKNLLEDVREL